MGTAATGTTITFGEGSTAIGEVISIGGPSVSVEMIDTTTHDSGGWKSFLAGEVDGGSISLEMCLAPVTADLLKDWLDGGTIEAVVITWPVTGGAHSPFVSFNAACSAWSPTANRGDKITLAVTLKVSGLITPNWT